MILGDDLLFHKSLLVGIVRKLHKEEELTFPLLYGTYNKKMQEFNMQKISYDKMIELIKDSDDVQILQKKVRYGTWEVLKPK